MNPFDLIGVNSLSSDVIRAHDALDPSSPEEYRQLAALLVVRWIARETHIVGIGGGQGSGKSTLCRLISTVGRRLNESIAILSLDDFYLTKQARAQLGSRVHPLLDTRGPPGTHEIKLLLDTMKQLRRGEEATVPVFDKGRDDRSGERNIPRGTRMIVVEGWCIGALPEPDKRLEHPVNELERENDPDGSFRRWVDQQLGTSYAQLTSCLDEFVYLRVPNMDSVRTWRLEQEQQRSIEQRMDERAIGKFVEYYERVTRWMMLECSERADVNVELGPDHKIKSIRLDKHSFAT